MVVCSVGGVGGGGDGVMRWLLKLVGSVVLKLQHHVVSADTRRPLTQQDRKLAVHCVSCPLLHLASLCPHGGDV